MQSIWSLLSLETGVINAIELELIIDLNWSY